MSAYNIAIGCDHGGLELKQAIVKYLNKKDPFMDKYTVSISDYGCHTSDSVDYPDYAQSVCESITKEGGNDFGILICGTGIGISIAANRYNHIRAGLCYNAETAALTRQHNNANVLCMGGRQTTPEQAYAIVDAFFTAQFEGGSHQKRIEKINLF
jgi:RpiB/LacA/LacB family sugar-phosphate isomerase